jgi:L-histidine N-alpha-methyltransferase
MSSAVAILIHPSQFPESVQRDLIESLRSRRVNHKFHYDSVKQTHKWLSLHQAVSPSRTDPDCVAIYEKSFVAAAKRVEAKDLRLVGLGCGGGQKDARLLRLLKVRGRKISYTPCDVSAAMVLVARQTALTTVAVRNCFPLVCDLASASDLPAVFEQEIPSASARLITFFGMIPNFEPDIILPRLAALVRAKDLLLFSANLAPGRNYTAGMKRILPQYDNGPTRDWLMTFLLDLGIERTDGALNFHIEGGAAGLKRVAAYFQFSRSREIVVNGESFVFRSGEAIRLFFSYRHTRERVGKLLDRHGLAVLDSWITRSGEEGVFLCRRRK